MLRHSVSVLPMKVSSLVLVALVASVDAIELTRESWFREVAGKNVLIKFIGAPTLHKSKKKEECTSLAADWDKLMEKYNSETVLIAKVDCEGAGHSLCNLLHIHRDCWIGYGNPFNMAGYHVGGEEQKDKFKKLEKLVTLSVAHQCSIVNRKYCADKEGSHIDKVAELPMPELTKIIEEKMKVVWDLEDDVVRIAKVLKTTVGNLHRHPAERNKEADEKIQSSEQQRAELALEQFIQIHKEKQQGVTDLGTHSEMVATERKKRLMNRKDLHNQEHKEL
jgi:hypothetical protein